MKKRIVMIITLAVMIILTSCSNINGDQPGYADKTETESIEESTKTPPETEEIKTEETDEIESADTTEADTTESGTTADTTDIPEPKFQMPDQSYIGVWYTDEYKMEDIYILEITSEYVKFEVNFVRLFGVKAYAKENNGELVFEDKNHPEITGKLKFEEDGITIIFDSYGPYEWHTGVSTKNSHKYIIKDSKSDEILEMARERIHW